MNVHRFEIFVPDAEVGHFQRTLLTHKVQVVSSQPVTNATFENGKVVAISNGGNLCERFQDWINKNPDIESLTSAEVQAWCASAGYSNNKGARYGATSCGVKHGFLKKAGSNTWTVLRSKASKPAAKKKAKAK